MSEPTAVPPPAPGPAPETGHPAVDAALAPLEELADLPAEAQAALFESVHEQLRQTLAGLDQPQPQPQP